jgi:hypothetical protein
MIPIITESEYDKVIKSYSKILSRLIKIVQSTGESLEGNCFYDDLTFNENKELNAKQRNLYSIGKSAGGNILEIGFNAGHSALLFLISNPRNKVLCFDICSHEYTKCCFNYLACAFPNRLELIEGDSATTLCKFKEQNPDYRAKVVHVDGSHEYLKANLDFFNSRDFAVDGSIVIWDDVWLLNLRQLWDGYIQSGLVKEFHLLETLAYAHALGVFVI